MATGPEVTALLYPTENRFFGNLLLRELGKREPRIVLRDGICGEPEILILNLDTVMAPAFLAGHRLPASAYKVFLVHDLNRSNMVFLKDADLIVYSYPFPRRMVEELLGLEYESTVIPFPSLVSGNAGLLEGFAAIGEAYEPDSGTFVGEVLETFYRWFRLANVRVIHLCMDVPQEYLADLENRIQDFEDNRYVEIRLVNRREAELGVILDIARRCACGEYFRREISE